ncbi:MAG: hypothetical protein COC16_00135 [Lutibacter sp.]|nr:MAG: hypothetical protein COC16_00135 [Lutibacter sp.]
MKNTKLLWLVLVLFLIMCTPEKSDPIIEEEIPQLTVQQRLDNNETPIKIFRSGVPLKDIYATFYKGGNIFYLDTITGRGIVSRNSVTTIGWNGCKFSMPFE